MACSIHAGAKLNDLGLSRYVEESLKEMAPKLRGVAAMIEVRALNPRNWNTLVRPKAYMMNPGIQNRT